MPSVSGVPPSPLLTRDARLLFATRAVRLFAYGFLSVILVVYLSTVGLSDADIGLLLSLTLAGDAAVSLWLTTTADRWGRKKTLLVGALMMAASGVAFALADQFWVLLVAGTVGVISPSGNEVGPFLSVEQAALSGVVPFEQRTRIFSWYNLVGSVATAVGALACGALTQLLQDGGMAPLQSYRVAMFIYAGAGVVLGAQFLMLDHAIEVAPGQASSAAGARAFLGLHQSRGIVARLSALFALDAFGGGFVIQSILAYWLHQRWGVAPATLGAIFFGANLLAALSALSAAALADRIGLINTMVFTHLPSNLLLMAVPWMPNVWLAVGMLLLRFSISQMDVPTRQSYVMAVVNPDERSAASGVTGVARSLGAALSPNLAMALVGNPALMALPFMLGGGLKIVYDLVLYRSFVSTEKDRTARS